MVNQHITECGKPDDAGHPQYQGKFSAINRWAQRSPLLGGLVVNLVSGIIQPLAWTALFWLAGFLLLCALWRGKKVPCPGDKTRDYPSRTRAVMYAFAAILCVVGLIIGIHSFASGDSIVVAKLFDIKQDTTEIKNSLHDQADVLRTLNGHIMSANARYDAAHYIKSTTEVFKKHCDLDGLERFLLDEISRKSPPDDSLTRELISVEVLRGKLESATTRIDELLKSYPGDRELACLKEFIDFWKKGYSEPEPRDTTDKTRLQHYYSFTAVMASNRGDYATALMYGKKNYELAKDDTPMSATAALCDLGKYAQALKQVNESSIYFGHAREIAARNGLRWYEADAIEGLGYVAFLQARNTECERMLDEAIGIYDELTVMKGKAILFYVTADHKGSVYVPAVMQAQLLSFRADRALASKNYQKAVEVYDRAAEMWKLWGSPIQAADCYAGAAIGSTRLGNLASNIRYLEMAIASDRSIGFDDRNYIRLFKIAEAHADMGNHKLAMDAFDRAKECWDHSKFKSKSPAECDRTLAYVLARADRKSEAIVHMKNLLEILKKDGKQAELGQTLNNLASLEVDLGQVPSGIKHAEEALRIFEVAHDLRGEAYAETTLAHALALAGQLQRSNKLAQKALATFSNQGELEGQGGALFVIGIVKMKEGEKAEARTMFSMAIEVLRRAGNQSQVWEVSKFVAEHDASTPLRQREQQREQKGAESLAAPTVGVH